MSLNDLSSSRPNKGNKLKVLIEQLEAASSSDNDSSFGEVYAERDGDEGEVIEEVIKE